MHGFEIREIRTAADRRRFVRLPWKVNRGDPNFVPPIVADELALCDPARHPFYAGNRAEGTFWLAYRGGEPVARIAAIRNPTHERHWNEPAGFFGFYECAETGEAGAEVTAALLERVRERLRAWGLTRMYGPASPSSNYQYGTLVEGFGSPPRLLMPYNPPYYDGLLTGAGLVKAKDLHAWLISSTADFSRLRRIAERIESRGGIAVRPLNLKRFEEELALVRRLIDDIWSENWGSVPMSGGEYALMAKALKPFVDPAYALVAEIGGEPVGFALALPDVFEALRSPVVNGRPFTPWGLAAFLWRAYVHPRIRNIRILLLGIRKDQRIRALGPSLYVRIFDAARRKGVHGGEASWVLEDNEPMNKALRAMEARVTKTYRIYRADV